ncbi:LacI family DNA-binding transcriptional regulator [Sphingomonas sp. RS2018]
MIAGTISPEQRLFVGVIVNAAQEAAGSIATRNRPAQAMSSQEDARTWFVEAGEDFATVCELAGFEPHTVRSQVLAYLDRVAADPAARVTLKRANMPSRRSALSMHDVARHAGVSATTVSNVIHDRPNVMPATRARVFAVIKALGYRHSVH